MFDQDVAGFLKARARARPLDCGFRQERGGGGRGARTGSDARGARYTHAWLGNLCEINTEADLEPEEPEPDMLRAWLGNLCEINTEADLEPEEPEQCAHAEPNGLEGNASVTAGTEAGIASGFSDALPGGGCEISSDKIPFGNTLEPDRLSFATLVATHVLLLEGETPTTEGKTPTSLVAIAAAVAATHVLHSEGETPTSLVAVAAAVATGGEPVEPEQHAAANKPEQRAHAEPNGLEGNASVTAGTEAGIASGFSDAPPETSTEAPPTGRPPDDAAAGALSAGAIKLESTGRPPDDAAAGALSAGAINDEETAGGIAALAPAGAGAGAAPELGVSTPIGPLAATVSSRRALLLPATRATPPAPAQLHSSSCAFPASSMSPGGVCEISSDEIAFAGDTLECGFASNSYDSPGRGGADGTGAKKPNYVTDKANQDQKPGGFSPATGRPPGDTAAGALSTAKLESGRGGAAAGAISADAPKLECTGRPPGGAAAGALSAGAIKLEGTGRPPNDAAAGTLSAGAIKIESERGLLGSAAAASALSAGTITKLEREVVREEAGVVARARTVGKGAEALDHGGGGGAADEVAGAEGEAIENVEVQPGLASDAPGYGGADEDDSPSRGGVDAAGLEEHSSDSSNEEPGYGAGRPRGDAAAGALSAGAIKLESTGRRPDDAAAGALSAGAMKSNASVTAGTEAGIASGFSNAPPETSTEAPPTGRPLDDAAAGALSAGAIKLESERGLLGPAATSALSAGANKPESKRCRLATRPLTSSRRAARLATRPPVRYQLVPPSSRSQADRPVARPLALSRRASPSSRVRTTQSATWR